MRKDPSHLINLGELATFKNFLGGYYHQDVWDEFLNHEEVWNFAIEGHSFNSFELLIEQMNEVLTWLPERIHNFIKDNESGGLYLKTPKDALIWLKKCRDYMVKGLKKKREQESIDKK